jgi:hypothetical protein
MPAFVLHGVLVYFAAFKNHIGMFPPIRRVQQNLRVKQDSSKANKK